MADKDSKVRNLDNATDSYVEGLSRNQTFLLPKTIEEYVEPDNPVRFIDAYINTLDMEKLGFTHSTPQDLGRPSYNPKDLCKLYLYGGLNHIRSSRKLERECKSLLLTNFSMTMVLMCMFVQLDRVCSFNAVPLFVKGCICEFTSARRVFVLLASFL